MVEPHLKTLALLDFDGTLTTKDSLGDFIQFVFGQPKTILGGMTLLPVLIGYALGWMNNSRAKQRVIKHFFAGMPLASLHQFGESYAKQRLPQILRPSGLAKLQWHQRQGHQVVIVSASCENWLKPWTDAIGVELLATQLEVKASKLTGRYLGENCHGDEKVRRIQVAYSLDDYNVIYAYGDTAGDRPMLQLATQAFYKPFR